MKKLQLIIFACLLIVHQAYAKKDIYSGSPINWNTSTSIPILSVPFPPINSFGGLNSLDYKTKTLNSYVKFWLNTASIPAGLSSCNAQVNITIIYYLEGQANPVTVNKLLTIDYNNILGAKYKNVALENFPNASSIEITNISLSINNAPATAIQKQFISLQTFIEHERYYNYYNVFGNNIYTPFLPTPVVLPNNVDVVNNEITITWNGEQFAEGYELEYTFIDDYGNSGMTNYLTDNQIDFSFQNNSTRILLEATSYRMPLVQEHGYLVFRVRGYSMAGAEFDRIFFGTHHATVEGNKTFNMATYPYKFAINSNLTHTKDSINWQSVTTFAEEGKSKTVVKYMDGTSRMRQTVTSTSTERNAIVAETIYDRQGRAAINVLPTPVDTAAIKYYKNFNLNLQGNPYNFLDFDLLNTIGCGNFSIHPLNQNSGAGNYYSTSNPNKTQFNAFIPDANGYPFTRVTYMPDATDRVVRQGNVGEIFQPGKTDNYTTYQKHDTKYFYGKPDQAKLDYLFGTNVGYAQFYQKNLVVDPNGQASVSYVDLDGKTIATALAGEAPPGIEKLRSNASALFRVDLLTGSDIVNEQDHSITNSQAFTVSGNAALYKFNYALNKNTYQALSCSGKNYCLDCIYDLEITLVKDECSKIEYQNKITVGTLTNLNFVCNDANAQTSLSFNKTLDVGSYTITKKLTVNKQAAEFYADSILKDPNNTCLKTFDDFYNDAWSRRDTTRCKEACAACNDEANNSEDQTANSIADAIKACDSLWCNPQMATMCDVARMSMINDLRPGGQYAIYKDDNGNISLGFSPISIFNAANISFKSIQGADVSIQNIPIYLPNKPTSNLSYYMSSAALAQQLFNNWPDDLSEKLLPLHPEYCYLKFCDLPFVQAGNKFDTKLMNAETFADAQLAFGASNVSATTIDLFYSIDDFYATMAGPLTSPNMQIQPIKDGIKNKFLDYTGQGHSIVKLALFMANCPSGNDINICPAVWGDAINADEEWQKFKSIYFTIKQEYLQRAREEFVLNATGCCPNNYIGCGTPNHSCPPHIWNNNFTHTIPTICNNNNNYEYASSIKRFTTINDIDFPGVPNPTTSLYDVKPEEMKKYLTSDSLKSPCLTCPELDAFKMMIWQLQDKKWIVQNKKVPADAVIGLKDALRERLIGSQKNEELTINLLSKTDFIITTGKCKLIFKADTRINWEKAEIVPTCLEIIDYKNAKLHIMVDGVFKTVLNISSDCEIFYCNGKAPTVPPVNNDCKCDSVYNNKKIYHIGDIVQYKGLCYIVKNVNEKNVDLTPGYHPGNPEFWNKLCNDANTCNNPFTLDFETLGGYDTQLSTTVVNNVFSIYNINDTINYITNIGLPLPSNAFIARLYGPIQILSKRARVTTHKTYKISFDFGVWQTLGNGSMTFELIINGQVIKSITPNNSQLQSVQSESIFWNSGNATVATIEFNKTDIGNRKVFSIDNIKMECLGDIPISANCKDPFVVNFDNNETYTTGLTSGDVPLQPNKYTVRNSLVTTKHNIVHTSKAMFARPGFTTQYELLIQKTAIVLPNTNYKFSFDAILLAFPDPDCFYLEAKINNQIVLSNRCIQDRNQPWINQYGWDNYSFNWNSGNNTTVTVEITSNKQNATDIIGLDNIQMLCTRNIGNTKKENDIVVKNDEKENRYIPKSTCGCNGLCDPELPSPEMPIIPCDSILKDIATQQASTAYANYKDSVFNALLNGYYEKCMQSLETFSMDYTDAEYHYTLYYYDQSGNLVQTVPPAGVKPLLTSQLASVATARNANNGSQILPAHFMKTNYNHNSLNAVVYQKTPDAGVSRFFYDKLGRIALSQNAKQWKPWLNTQLASYTYYDRLGRTVEVGEVQINWQNFITIKNTVSNYANWQIFLSIRPRTEITKTFYDNPYFGIAGKIDIAFGANGQQNLRNRIGTVAYFANNINLATDKYDHATHYNYDIAGNVTDLLQDFGTNSDFGTDATNVSKQSKHIAYSFDLVSGKVNQVHYQKNYADQFLYKYAYNADNKLTAVFTSTNGLIWENDARYKYYRHGPLARTELGTDGVQGTDYAYTLQGWIKGVNGKATMPSDDIGQDGTAANTTTIGYQAQNRNTAPDVYSYWLGYNKEDYKAIAGNTAYLGNAIQPLQTGAYHTTPAELFNGNIRSMYTNIQPFGGLGMHYKYDQLNRIKKQEGFNIITNTPEANNAYSMALEYDPNGNIQKLLRNGTAATPAMDSLNYYYYNANGTTYRDDPTSPFATNKLAFATDYTSNTINYTDDIDNQPINNYSYDAIGNLIRDNKEGIPAIKWNLQNKITAVVKGNGKNAFYSYDALGNRIKKVVYNGANVPSTQYYVRDAQGNTMAIYEVKNNNVIWAEQHLYGSSRLGIYKPDINLAITPATLPALSTTSTTRNTTEYELTNHLGNVLVTITDSRTNNNNTATLLNATDYYAFGMAMPDRKYNLNNTKNRYGFNGKENDEETGTQDYGFRVYNPALGKFLSVDPLADEYAWNSTYSFAENDVIRSIDLDGKEKSIITIYTDGEGHQVGETVFEILEQGSGTEYRFFKNTGGYNYELLKTQFVSDINVSSSLFQNFTFGTKGILGRIQGKLDSYGSMKNYGVDEGYSGMKKWTDKGHGAMKILGIVPHPLVKSAAKIFDGIITGMEVAAEVEMGNNNAAVVKAVNHIAIESIKWSIKSSLPKGEDFKTQGTNEGIMFGVGEVLKQVGKKFEEEAKKLDDSKKYSQQKNSSEGKKPEKNITEIKKKF
jgi:RHS repeat-associated protein